ncbi:hypothetical protein FB639_001379 [Coemansia asiatica]|nr:hypothetical protein FB639_001379 [Coemansia asiatica]
MKQNLSLFGLLPLIAIFQAAAAQKHKCDQADGVGRGYTVNGNEAHQCDEGTSCYQLGQGVYCGAGAGDVMTASSYNNTVAPTALPAPYAPYAPAPAPAGICDKNSTAAVCKGPDGTSPDYYKCVDGKPQSFSCGGSSVCHQDGHAIVCGVSNSTSSCTPGALKCGAADGTSPEFSRCVDGEQVSLTCGAGLSCYQEGPFHVSCGPYKAGNTHVEYPVNPVGPTTVAPLPPAPSVYGAATSASSEAPYVAPGPAPGYANANANTGAGAGAGAYPEAPYANKFVGGYPDALDKSNGPSMIRSKTGLRSREMNLMEIDIDYNPHESNEDKHDTGSNNLNGIFDRPEAFSRDMENFAMSQGYNRPTPHTSSHSDFADEKYIHYAAASDSDYSAQYSPYPMPSSYPENKASATVATYVTPAAFYNAHTGINAPFAAIVPETVPFPQLLFSLQSAMQFNQAQNAYAPTQAPAYGAQPAAAYGTQAPSYATVLRALAMALKALAMALKALAMALKALAMALKALAMALKAPFTALRVLAMTLRDLATAHRDLATARRHLCECGHSSTHTVYVSIETNTENHCVNACGGCDDEGGHKHKHHHKHGHKHKGKHEHKHKGGDDDDCGCESDNDSDDECSSTPSCTTSSDTCHPSPTCETTSECDEGKHKHKHKHKHKCKDGHKHKHKHKHDDCEECSETCAPVSEIDEADCFGRAVLSIINNGEESVTTVGKQMFEMQQSDAEADSDSDEETVGPVQHNAVPSSCPTSSCASQNTHTAYESVETGCQCGGKCGKGCTCGGHCTCGAASSCASDNTYHTVLVSVGSTCQTPSSSACGCSTDSASCASTPTAYASIETGCVTHSSGPTHVVLKSVETGCVSASSQNTHTVYKSVEQNKCGESKCPTHAVLEHVETGKVEASSQHTHVVYQSVETGCAPVSSQNTHTVYESIESHCSSCCGNSNSNSNCGCSSANTHTVYQSVETGCAPVSSQNTHTVYKSIESHCSSCCGNNNSNSNCGCSSANTHTVYQSVESHCETGPAVNTHTVYQSIETQCSSCGSGNSSNCGCSSANTHTVYESVESGCKSKSAQNTHTAFVYIGTNGCNSHIVLQTVESSCASACSNSNCSSNCDSASSCETNAAYRMADDAALELDSNEDVELEGDSAEKNSESDM